MSMEYVWEVVVNAAAADIVGRIFSCAIDNLLCPSSPGGREPHRRRLELLLGSIGSAVDEAEGRDITGNLNLLAQLKVLNDAKYRGRFALEVTDLDDAVKNAAIIGDDDAAADDSLVVTTTGIKRKLALCSPLKTIKCARLILRGGDGAVTEKRLAAVTEELEALCRDYLRDFILLVQGYARRNKVQWPVATTLFMDQCVFGRHVETERIVAFLRQPAPSAGLSVLAVVGGSMVGKTTLVKHVAADQRVRDHFAHVDWFGAYDVLRTGGWLNQKCDSVGPKYLEGLRRILEDEQRVGVGRCLVVFDDALFIDGQVCAALLATTKLDEGSKLLFTCHDADFARIIGTVEPVVLRPVPEEEYWYYFKALAFGGTDPRDHPQITAVGREISRHPRRTFMDTRVLGQLLRANFNVRSWRRVLAAIVNCQKTPPHVLLDLLPVRARRHWWLCWTPTSFLPKLTLQDVLSASVASSSSSGTCCLGGVVMEEEFTIHIHKETLYMDYWYGIFFKKNAPTTSYFTKIISTFS